MRPRYHIRWKVILWGMMIIVSSSILCWALTPFIETLLLNYISSAERGRFIIWISQGLTYIVFIIFALLLVIITSKTMVNRVLELSLAAKEIARGNFSVRVSDIDRHDEVYQLALDFNRMAEQLQRNEYMRKDFISNVSHEIKTPLSVINGYVDLLLEEPEAAEGKEYLEIISRESRRLLRISQNMLHISQLDNDSIRKTNETFRLDEQLRQVILLLEPHWSSKDIELDINLDECFYTGDPELLVQVWVNLLDNAIKFTPASGKIAIGLQEHDRIQVTVADTGIGMDQEAQQRIYEQFYQGDRSRRREGAGLGMSIVKRIIDLHEGDISIHSALGEGTKIDVFLPKKNKPSVH